MRRLLIVAVVMLACAPASQAAQERDTYGQACAGKWYSDNPEHTFCRVTALRKHARHLRRQAVEIASQKWRAKPRKLRLAWSVPPMKAEHAWWRAKVRFLAKARSLKPPVPHYATWLRLAECESGSRWSYNGPSGYDGALQFHPRTWTANGGGRYAAYAWGATSIEQMLIAERVLRGQGWGAWPACSAKLGLR